jgi:hypothetical protein
MVHSPIPRFERLPGLNCPVGAKIMVLIARLLASLKWMPAVSGTKITSPMPPFEELALRERLFDWREPLDPTQLTTPINEEERLTFGLSVL